MTQTNFDRQELDRRDRLSDMKHRPPHRKTYQTTTKPLIVTPTFVSRADNTAWAHRPHDDGFTLNRHGKPVENPSVESSSIALEPTPNLAFEHWDEYWRKVHGPKFAYEEPGSTTELRS
ncbi:hypothetical protein C7B62_21315 [Pleurocapsa sp. CCALA 161]|nr:hypothetical protein C7B62_21315 [Pleurocapsa sp. CCALA 161]